MSYYPQQYPGYPPQQQQPPPPQQPYQQQYPGYPPPPQQYPGYQPPQPPQGPPPPQAQQQQYYPGYQPKPPQGPPPPAAATATAAQQQQPRQQGLYPQLSSQGPPPPPQQQPPQGPARLAPPQVDVSAKTLVLPLFVPYVMPPPSQGPTMQSCEPTSYVDIDGYPVNGGVAPPLLGGYNGTVDGAYSIPLPTPGFDPAADVETLVAAMKGVGTRDRAVVKVVGNRTRAERLAIAAKYKEMHGKDLVKELIKETSGNYQHLIVALFKPLDVLLAEIAHSAMAGLGTNDAKLIDVITQFSGPDMAALKEAYQRLYKKSLAADVRGDTSGSYRKVLLRCVEGSRPAPGRLESQTTAQQVAMRLYKAGEARLGTDDTAFIEIITGNSAEFLQVVSTEYKKSRGKYLIDAIKSETSFHYRDALVALASTPGQHFARRISEAVVGLGTADNLLINIFAMLEKPQLKSAALAFERIYGEQMPKKIASDTSGNYRDLLLELLC